MNLLLNFMGKRIVRYPSWLKHLWTFKQGTQSKVGPDMEFLYPTGSFPDFAGGVCASTIPPIDPEKGWFGGPGYTSLNAGTFTLTNASFKNGIFSATAVNGLHVAYILPTTGYVLGAKYGFVFKAKNTGCRYIKIHPVQSIL